jgi:hypothetical protein
MQMAFQNKMEIVDASGTLEQLNHKHWLQVAAKGELGSS